MFMAGLMSGFTPLSATSQAAAGHCDRHGSHTQPAAASAAHQSHGSQGSILTLTVGEAQDGGCAHCPPAECALTAACATSVAPNLPAPAPAWAVTARQVQDAGWGYRSPHSITLEPHLRPPISIL